MKIRYGTVTVQFGKPYNTTRSQSFKVREGESYIKTGFKIGRILQTEFTEELFDHPTPKDFRYIESISEIKVTRFS